MKRRISLCLIVFTMATLLCAISEGTTETISRDLLIQLNRSELQTIGEIDGPIYVFGHNPPDSDSVCTSIGYAYILRQLGFDAQPVTLGPVNNETACILKSAGVEVPPILEDASGENVVLVDHAEISQSAEGLQDANILMIIDHHGSGTVTTGKPIIYDARPIGSTATIAWLRAINYGVDLDAVTSHVLLGGILSDTVNLKTDNTTEADRAAVRFLSVQAGITDVDAFYQEMYRAQLSYEGMTDKEILLSDMKEYETKETRYIIGIVNLYDVKEAPEMIKRMRAIMPDVLSETGAAFGYVKITIFHDNINVNYIVPSDDVAAELLDIGLGEQGTWEDGTLVLNHGISRKAVLVPAITEALALHPTE